MTSHSRVLQQHKALSRETAGKGHFTVFYITACLVTIGNTYMGNDRYKIKSAVDYLILGITVVVNNLQNITLNFRNCDTKLF